MVSTPEISVCIPARNAERHLASTLRAVLTQSVSDLEVVVVDNASTDRTAEIVERCSDPRIRLVRNEKLLSLPDNWNLAVRSSRGEMIKLVCADDLIHPDLVRRQQLILADPSVAVVASRRHLVDDGGRLLVAGTGLRGLVGRFDGAEVAARVVRNGGNPIGEPGGVLFRRRDFDALGGFDEAYDFPIDLHLWMRLLTRGDFVGQAEPMAAFRASTGSLSSQVSRSQYDEQVKLTREIAHDDRWGVGRRDRALSRMNAPLARMRRELLFWAADQPGRGVLAPIMAGPGSTWLPTTCPAGDGEPPVRAEAGPRVGSPFAAGEDSETHGHAAQVQDRRPDQGDRRGDARAEDQGSSAGLHHDHGQPADR